MTGGGAEKVERGVKKQGVVNGHKFQISISGAAKPDPVAPRPQDGYSHGTARIYPNIHNNLPANCVSSKSQENAPTDVT